MERPESPRLDPTVFWIAAILSAAFVLWGVLAADNLTGVTSAAPFVLVMIGICFSLFKELRTETVPGVVTEPGAPEPERAASRSPGAPAPQQTRVVDPESRG